MNVIFCAKTKLENVICDASSDFNSEMAISEMVVSDAKVLFFLEVTKNLQREFILSAIGT